LQEVTSQDDIFMLDVSGYIWERVKANIENRNSVRLVAAGPVLVNQ